MGEDEQLRQQAAQLGSRFLTRTMDELAVLEECLQRTLDGSSAAREECIQLAHRIHGSSAMFGFDDISQRAGALEEGVRSAIGPDDHLLTAFAELQSAVHSAARARHLV